MKKMWVLLFLFFVSVPAILAVTVYSGTVYSGDVVTAGKDQYLIVGSGPASYERNYTYLKILRNGTINETIRVPFTDCVSSTSMTYCFTDQTIDYSSAKAIYDDRIEPKLKISIATFDPEITVEHPKTLTVDYGVDTVVNITITNRGKKGTTLTYTEIIPSTMSIISYTNALLKDSILSSTLTIPANSTSRISYVFRAVSYTNTSWGASYTYDSSSGQKNGTLPKLAVQIRSAVDFKEYLSKTVSTSLETADNATYRLTITNNDRYNSAYEVILIDVGALQVLHAEQLEQVDSSTYRYTGTINPKTAVNHTLIFTSAYTGVFPIRLNASVDVLEQRKKLLGEKNYTVKVSGIRSKILLSTTTARPGDTVLATIAVENPDTKNSYHAIEGVIHFFGDEPFSATTIRPAENKTLATRWITMPQTNQTTWVVTVDGTYRTASGQVFPFNTNATIKLFIPVVTSANKTPSVPPPSNTNNTPANTTIHVNTSTTPTNPAVNITDTSVVNKTSTSAAPAPEKTGFSKIISEIGDFFKRIFGGN